MEQILKKYDLVVGMEIHVQLKTESKLFAADKNSYGDEANANVSPITLAHPGTLPMPNKKAIELAIKMGLAIDCQIARFTAFDRKNYFYPDLPKGYQVTQDAHPICIGGKIKVKSGDDHKDILFNRIHIEEDAGKSMHDAEHEGSMLDFNRAGTPLIEMVTEPCISSAEEAGNLLSEVRRIIRYLDVGDGNMEEGSLRCDANISIKPKGSDKLGQKVEIKNMNSIRNVQRAIEHEIKRQSDLLEKGETILQETRGFNDSTGETTGQRTKEEANDYRYFPDPDLLPINVTEKWIQEIEDSMPKLPSELMEIFQSEYGLKSYESEIIVESKEKANYFLNASKYTKNYKSIANWIIGPIKNYLNDTGTKIDTFPVSEKLLGEIIDLIDQGEISSSIASTRLLPKLIDNPNISAKEMAEQMDLIQHNDEDALERTIQEVFDSMPDKVVAYKKGKKGLMGLFVGQVMKKSGGKANPKLTNELIAKMLDK